MFKRLVAFFVGVIVAICVFSLSEKWKLAYYPIPDNIDPHDLNAMKYYEEHLPPTALFIILFGWVVGSFVCGLLVAIVGKSSNATPAYIAGLFLTTAGIVDLFITPHPVWFIIVGMLVFIPITLLGNFLARKR
jgi:hypothetical protein